jgi:hypothetical protein
MNPPPQRVHVILDPTFGQRLAQLPAHEPVWIVRSADNDPIVHELWQSRTTKSHLDGITLFNASDGSPEEAFLDILGSVDLHHGAHSADPPYALLEVTGCPLSEEIRAALDELGFAIIGKTENGFSAQRSSPPAKLL